MQTQASTAPAAGDKRADATTKAIIAAVLEGKATEQQADPLYAMGPEAVALWVLATTRRIAELQGKLKGGGPVDPATPSGSGPFIPSLQRVSVRANQAQRPATKGLAAPNRTASTATRNIAWTCAPTAADPCSGASENAPAPSRTSSDIIYRTLKLRGHNPLTVIPQALRTYLSTGTLPPLPSKTVANG